MNASYESNSRLSGTRLRLVRTVWLLLVGSILVMYGLVAYESLFKPLSVCETQACSMTPAQFEAWQAAGIRPEVAALAHGDRVRNSHAIRLYSHRGDHCLAALG